MHATVAVHRHAQSRESGEEDEMPVIRAEELMTRDVVAVGPDKPTQEIARLLLEHRISAVPVVDSSGAPIGMVSEGDLVGGNEVDREARRDWWLELLAEGKA